MVANDDLKLKIDIEAEADTKQVEQEAKNVANTAQKTLSSNKIKLELQHNLDSLQKELKKTRTEYENLKRTAKSASDYVRLQWLEEDLKDINYEIAQTKGALKDLGAEGGALDSIKKMFTGGAIVAGVTAFGQKILELGDNAQQAQISFTTMLGDADQAKALLQELSDFAKTTPFELQGIRESAKQLLAMGVSAEEMIPTLKALWDVSAGLSVPMERLALNYGQVLTQGKLTGKELKDFTTAWVPLLDELSKNLGKSKTEIQDMVSAGKISAKDMVDAFDSMTSAGGRFADLMEAQSQTLSGQWSNLQDTLAGIGEQIGLAVIPMFTDMVQTVATTWEELNNMGGQGITAGEFIAKAIAVVVEGIRGLILIIQTVGKVFGSVIGNCRTISSSFWKDLSATLNNLVTNSKQIFSAFGNNIKVWIAKGVQGAIDKLNGLLNRVKTNWGIDLGSVGNIDTGEYQDFKIFDFTNTQNAIEAAKADFKDVANEIADDWGNLAEKVTGDFDNIKDAFKKSSTEVRANSKAINKEINAITNGSGGSGGGSGSKADPVKQKKEELQKLRDLKIKEIQDAELSEKEKNERLLEVYDWYKNELIKVEGKTNDELLKNAEEYLKDYYKTMQDASEKEQKATLESTKKVKDYNKTIEKLGDSREDYKNKAIKNLKEVDNSIKELDDNFSKSLIERYNQVKEELENNKDRDTYERFMDRYSRDEIADKDASRFGDTQKKDILEYYDLTRELEILNERLTKEQKQQAEQLDKQTETERMILEYEQQRAKLTEQKAIYEAVSKQWGLDELGKKAIEVEGDIVKYWDETKQQYVEIQDFKNQQLALELANQADKITAEYELTVKAKNDEIALIKEHSKNVLELWKSDTKAYKKELDNRLDAVKEYVAEVRAALASVPSSYRAYGGELNSGVTMVGENWPEAIVRRQASYVQPRNAVQNYSTVNNTSSNLNINGLELWYNSVDEMLADFKSRLTYRN